MKKLFTTLTILFLIIASTSAYARSSLRLATTTSTENTGLLDYLLPDFEKANGVEIHVIAVGTGKALRLARDGEADVVMVHAPDLERKFVKDGFGLGRKELMYNDFVIVGPKSDPAGIKGKSVADAFKLIAERDAAFVSRGDNSGTDIKEKAIWKSVGVKPSDKNYLEVGQGMGTTLNIANEKRAYTMVDRATYLAMQDKVQLKILIEGDKTLFNQYSVIVINPEMIKNTNFKTAQRFEEWMISKPTQKKIAKFRKHGKQLFYPNAK